MQSRLLDISIRRDSTIRTAMEAIQRGACWIALVVEDDVKLLGLITDGDIRRALLAGAALSDSVEKYMRREFTAVQPTAGRSEVLDLMQARSLNQIPIVDEAGKLVGLHLLHEIIGAVPRPNWAVIMAGGRGERLRPLTDNIPKPMIKVAGRPILERIVLHLMGFGIRRFFLSVNYLSQIIEEHFGDGSALGCKIEYLREKQALGTGGALGLLPEKPQHPLLMLNGDLLTEFDVGCMIAFHAQGNYAISMGVHDYVQSVPFGVLQIEDNRLVAIREKPTMIYPTNAGIYLINPQLLERIPKNVEYSMLTLIDDCLGRGEPIGAFRIEEDWLDVGRPQELQRARGNPGT
ncbi:MAG: nucleotidyltransferase family protein [Thermoguttaceae bacterium]